MPVRTRVGHSFIKAEMAKTGAVFGGEHSAHYYFADFFRADTGMLAALHVLAALGGRTRPLSRAGRRVRAVRRVRRDQHARSPTCPRSSQRSGEWAAERGAEVDELDGLTVTLPGGRWFNVRPSNTEPLLRLNVEAPDASAMADLRDEILSVIRS